jgi:hypothetical protein
MEGKLIKTGDQFLLRNKEDEVIAITSGTMEGRMLSLKNCQAIENGYDLDELAKKHYDVHIKQGHTKEDSLQRKIDFILGFQKALEILGDKKFSRDDLMLAIITTQLSDSIDRLELIQSLQHVEWDVEVCCYIGNGDKESDSFKDPFVTNTGIPKLDNNGCLILRRK